VTDSEGADPAPGGLGDGERPDGPRRPEGVNDATVAAVGKLTEAFEWVERARGHLYEFHQLMGHADLLLGEAVERLDDAGHGNFARDIERTVVGRNVLYGRWTFQIVEEFDDGYYADITGAERNVRNALLDGRRHVFESEMKERERTPGLVGHERLPGPAAGDGESVGSAPRQPPYGG
jgi:hypothetical protein